METAHGLGRAEAIKRLKDKFDVVRAKHGGQASDLVEQWTDNVLSFAFKAMGMHVSGTVTIDDSSIRLSAKLPLAASMFKGMIEQQIRKELVDVLV
jgi:hypothetical protein